MTSLATVVSACSPAPSKPDAAADIAVEMTRPPAPALDYPATPTVAQVDRYHGEVIADPYRWLEDLDSDETRSWIEAQNALTFSQLENIPGRDAIAARLTELWNYEKFGVPSRRGQHYLYSYNDGLKNQPQLLLQDGLEGVPRVLLDANALSADGTVALSGSVLSEDGQLLAYGTSSGGSDWQEWRVRDVASGQDLPDRVRWVKFCQAEWAADASGFWYCAYDPPADGDALKAVNKFQKLYFHRLGTDQSEDVLVYQRQDQPDWGFAPTLSDDGRHLIINVWRSTEERNLVFLKPLDRHDAPVIELIPSFEYSYSYVGNDGDDYFFLTDDGAARRRLIAIDITQPAQVHWRELIPESDATLQDAVRVGGRFLVHYLRDAASELKVFALDGAAAGRVPLPALGTASGFERAKTGDETFFAYTQFSQPATIQRLDLASTINQTFRAPKLAFDPADYETRQLFFTSKDGTRIPMFVVAKKGVRLTGANPTLLYGYGGFNSPLSPAFAPYNLAWLELGGVYAAVNLRGGGEYGRDWHHAGIKHNKQNVFDDMAAAAEHLIAQRYTAPAHLAIHGRSNGGLLAAAVAMQRPDLFAAAVPGVGVLDMLRFREFTIGWAWESDYGSVLNPDDYRALRAYSPLHNLHTGVDYPAFLITTGDHDDRVFPAHSFKFAAALQAVAPARPALIRIDVRAGHGAGKPTAKQIAEWADILGFIGYHTGLSAPGY